MKIDLQLIFELKCRRYLAEVELLCNLDKKYAYSYSDLHSL